MTGFLTNAVEIYSYDPVTLRFPGCGECYFRFPFTKFFGKTDMTFSFHARWESFNSWSRILDFGFGPDSNNILFANRGGEPHITVRYMNGAG